MANATILVGDVLARMAELADNSLQECVTSPPYWGLRDYGVPPSVWPDGWVGCFGIEPTPELYIDHAVMIFREVRRVLHPSGVCWINIGDSYATGGGKVGDCPGGGKRGDDWAGRGTPKRADGSEGRSNRGPMNQPNRMPLAGLKPKDLVGIPWRLAFGLQADGWWLRQDCIWNKPNPMPSSARDRCTTAHEYLFLLSKSARYYYNADAIAEDCSENTHKRRAQGWKTPDGWDTSSGNGGHGVIHKEGREDGFTGYILKGYKGSVRGRKDGPGQDRRGKGDRGRKLAAPGSGTKNNSSFDEAMAIMPEKRNKRSVWTVTPQPYKEAHFATYPEALVEPCILAGSKPQDTVLDLFCGSGTTGVVALRYHRNFVGIELNPEYALLAQKRIGAEAPMFNTVEVVDLPSAQLDEVVQDRPAVHADVEAGSEAGHLPVAVLQELVGGECIRSDD